ncbi:MAG: hypothetical protein AB1405_00245 [Bdellovibrionota bacterium]
MRLLVWSLAGGGAVLAALLAYLVFSFPSEWARVELEKRLSKTLGARVTVGHLGIDLLHGLEAREIRVAPESEAASWFSLKSLILEVEFFPLLRGEVIVRALRLEDLDLLLEKDSSGKWNWVFLNPAEKPAATPEPAAATPPGPLDLKVRIEEFEIARANFHLRTPDFALDAGPFWLSAQGSLEKDGRIDAKLSARRDDGTAVAASWDLAKSKNNASMGLEGELSAFLEKGDLANARLTWDLSPLALSSAGREEEFSEGARIELEASASLASAKGQVGRLSVAIPETLSLAASASADWSGPLKAEVRLSELELLLSGALRRARIFMEKPPRVEGTLSLKDLLVQVQPEGASSSTRISGGIGFSEGAFEASGAVMEGLTASLSASDLRLGAGGLPEGGAVRGEIGWKAFARGAALAVSGASFTADAKAEDGKTQIALDGKAGLALSAGSVRYDGPLSLSAAGRLDSKGKRFDLSSATAGVKALSLSASGSFPLESASGDFRAKADANVDVPAFLESWLRVGGTPSALEVAGLAGNVKLSVRADRKGKEPLSGEAGLSANLFTGSSGSFSLSEGVFHLAAKTRHRKDFSMETASAKGEASAAWVGTGGRGARDARLELNADISGKPSEQVLEAKADLRVRKLEVDDPKAKARLAEAPPLHLTAQASTQLQSLATNVSASLGLGESIGLRVAGNLWPKEERLDLQARSAGDWALSEILAILPTSVRAPLRGGTAGGVLSWNARASGRYAKKEKQGFPLDLRGNVNWRGVDFSLVTSDISVSGLSGEVRIRPGEGRQGVEAAGHLQADSSRIPAFRSEKLGPTVASFRAKTEDFSEFQIEELFLYSDALKTAIKAGAEIRPAASPPTLSVRANVVLGTPKRWTVRPGMELAGTLNLALSGERVGEGPLRVRGEAGFSDFSAWLGKNVTVEGVSGKLPLVTDLSLRGAPLLSYEPLVGAETSSGPLRSVLYRDFLALDPPPEEPGLRIGRIEAARMVLSKVHLDGRLEGADVAVDNLSAAFLDGSVSGNARVHLEKPLYAQVSLGARDLDFRRIIPAGRLAGYSRKDVASYLVNGDVNAKVFFAPLDLQGEVELTRVGREVVYAILDWVDPQRANAGITNVRQKLEKYAVIGPKIVSFKAEHGNADLSIFMREQAKASQLHLLLGYCVVTRGCQLEYTIPRIALKSLLGVYLK